MIWKPKKNWSCDLKYENHLILWSEIRKHFDLMIWDRKIIWSYDLRNENNLIQDHFGRDHVILISSYFVIAWFWSANFCDPRFLDHFFLWSRDFDLENFMIFNFLDHTFWFHNCEKINIILLFNFIFRLPFCYLSVGSLSLITCPLTPW